MHICKQISDSCEASISYMHVICVCVLYVSVFCMCLCFVCVCVLYVSMFCMCLCFVRVAFSCTRSTPIPPPHLCLSVCLAIYLTVSNSLRPSPSFSIYLFVCPSICLCVSPHPSASLSLSPSVCLSIYLSMSLSLPRIATFFRNHLRPQTTVSALAESSIACLCFFGLTN